MKIKFHDKNKQFGNIIISAVVIFFNNMFVLWFFTKEVFFGLYFHNCKFVKTSKSVDGKYILFLVSRILKLCWCTNFGNYRSQIPIWLWYFVFDNFIQSQYYQNQYSEPLKIAKIVLYDTPICSQLISSKIWTPPEFSKFPHMIKRLTFLYIANKFYLWELSIF